MSTSSNAYGIIAEFDKPAAIMHAAEKINAEGFRNWDVYTPYPIHGMDKAMGIPNSKVGYFAFVGGISGFALGMTMIYFMNKVSYPLIVGGKPMFSPHGAFPPSYELTILLGAFGAILGMMFLNGLPRLNHPLLKHKRFALATHDRFFLVIETSDRKYNETETRKLLNELGCTTIELVED